MNIKKLEAFIMVVEKKSFSDAASALGSSQPAVSLKIKSLEDEIGLNLLDRSVSVIQPTSAGLHVYLTAKKIVKQWNRLEEDLHGFHESLTGTLTVGASTIPGTYLVPKWIKQFRKMYPKVDVNVEINDSRKILSKLNEQKVDIGIIGLQENLKNIQYRKIATDSLVLITPNDHPLLHMNQNFSFDLLKQYDFIMREEGSGTRKEMEHYLGEYGIAVSQLKSVVSMGSTEGVIAAVEVGLGVSFISRLAALPALKANRVSWVDTIVPAHRDFYYVTRKDTNSRPIIKEFTEILYQTKNEV